MRSGTTRKMTSLAALLLRVLLASTAFGVLSAPAALRHGSFIVHCEPLLPNDPARDPVTHLMDLQRPAMYWDALAELVGLAESNGHFLTIMFTPQWSVYASLVPARRLQVAEWTHAGHELALHHHGEEALIFGSGWDGFSNLPSLQSNTNFFGDIPFMMTQGIYTNYTIRSATTEDGDWPDGILYYLNGGGTTYTNADHPGDLISTASATSMVGLVTGSEQRMAVWGLKMRLFTHEICQTQVLAEVQAALTDFTPCDSNRWLIAFVTHVKNFYDEKEHGHYEELFQQMTANGIQLMAVTNAAAFMNLDRPVAPPVMSCTPGETNLWITWETTNEGQTYQVQTTTNLLSPNWTNILSTVTGDGSNHLAQISDATNASSFYRVIVQE
ncbi:MAG: hypothetical protein PHP44_04195 [Kiritimatiellae bacterium]|nr:hypothetical protein [Kiritimatiellia bacterium]MDD4735289.1 hypothetical protein [Kiritimatiellia bacterium]